MYKPILILLILTLFISCGDDSEENEYTEGPNGEIWTCTDVHTYIWEECFGHDMIMDSANTQERICEKSPEGKKILMDCWDTYGPGGCSYLEGCLFDAVDAPAVS